MRMQEFELAVSVSHAFYCKLQHLDLFKLHNLYKVFFFYEQTCTCRLMIDIIYVLLHMYLFSDQRRVFVHYTATGK